MTSNWKVSGRRVALSASPMPAASPALGALPVLGASMRFAASRRLAATLGVAASLGLAATLGLAAATPALADGEYLSPTNERVRISLGAMHLSSRTDVRADSSARTLGTQLSGEGDFGLDKTDFEPKFQAMVRAGVRHRLTFDYFTLDRTGGATVTSATPILFRNVTFAPGDPLQTKLSLRTFGITYGYSLWHSETLEIAPTLGVHATDLSALVKVQTQTRYISQSEDQAGPVPTLGVDATWVASKRFYLDGRAQYLTVHINNLDGTLGMFEFDALYRYRPNVSFAVGYSQIRARLSSTQSSQGGRFDFNTRGPMMFFRVAF